MGNRVRRGVLWLLTAAILLTGLPLHATAAAPNAAATVLLEARTGQVLTETNGDAVLPMGTMAKLMTVLLTADAVACGQLSEDTVVTASPAANARKGASIWLMPGEKMTVGELLQGVIVGNANDAAVALAEAVSDTEQAFVMDMNARAFDLGMRSTVFTNADGTPDPAQVTTARDLALLCRELLTHSFLLPYLTTWRTFLRGESTELVNENTLTRTYEGMLGIKAGHGEDTGYTLALAAQRDGMVCIAVVLGCPDEKERFAIGKTLLSAGFSGYQVTTPAFADEFLHPVEVHGGTASAVQLTAEQLRGITVPSGQAALRTVVVLPVYADAPVRQGQRLGTAAFYAGDTLLYETALVAAEDVPQMTISAAFLRLLDNMLK